MFTVPRLPEPPKGHFWHVFYDADFQSLVVQYRRKRLLWGSLELDTEFVRSMPDGKWSVGYRLELHDDVDRAVNRACQIMLEYQVSCHTPDHFASYVGNHYRTKRNTK
ncbi:hypothetical protein PXH69_24590 [Rhodococcus qingshengii]|uniref:Transposase n=1 Tax=Rhodococcus qingshengii TaxID=334542 RepID=A0AAW6LT47_RHOSG|nr:hypothetical protein [Rhodococcus qingshengii]MDE8648150.1 hypothetical protein [Rhodococcus qingshengii]